jgi:hypothetical protein
MKTLLIFTSILVLAAGCSSDKKSGEGAPPPATTITTYGAPGTAVTTQTGSSAVTVYPGATGTSTVTVQPAH